MQSRTSKGFTLIEVLVALTVLSVGMLGMAALFVEAVSSGRVALARTQAVNLVADLADRIRANSTAVLEYDTFGGATGAPQNNNCSGVAPVDCTPQQMAQHDLFQWLAAIGATLPAPTANTAGTVQVTAATNPNTYVITVNWSEPTAGGDLSYVLTVQL
ncbi:MAG: type IV pilus modification protein PilV [Gammaproteobacteria bacterium]